MLKKLCRTLITSLIALCFSATSALATPPEKSPPATAEKWCHAISGRLHSVSLPMCQKLTLKAAPLLSANKNALMWSDYPVAPSKLVSNHPKPQRPLRILMIGGIHGDELTSVSIVFRWLQWINEAQPSKYHWRVIPVANPDGLLSAPSQRMNGHGVDLNRNFPTPDWAQDAHAYWTQRTKQDPRRFPGKEAMSENETRWLYDQIEAFNPDLIVSIHAPYGILDFDGPARQPRRFGHLDLNRLGTYPGSLGNFGGNHKSMPVITIELPSATSMPSLKEQREIWDDMQTWIRRNLANKNLS